MWIFFVFHCNLSKRDACKCASRKRSSPHKPTCANVTTWNVKMHRVDVKSANTSRNRCFHHKGCRMINLSGWNIPSYFFKIEYCTTKAQNYDTLGLRSHAMKDCSIRRQALYWLRFKVLSADGRIYMTSSIDSNSLPWRSFSPWKWPSLNKSR